MSTFTISILVGALASIASIPGVNAHGRVSGIVANGQWYQGIGFLFHITPPNVVGWMADDWDLGFVNSGNYTNPDIICHRNATPDAHTIEVAAGGTVELQWTPWPTGHHGPVLDYLANCNGDCETVDKNSLEFFKISEGGLIDDSVLPGTWASDQLIANNNSWVVTVPPSIAPGNYVLRHEIIALQFANVVNGAQNYPQCFNLKITGSGTESPPGISATKFYTAQDPGVLFSLYDPVSKGYVIPGPAMFDGSSSSTGNSSSSVNFSSSSSAISSPVSSVGSYDYSSISDYATSSGYSASTIPASSSPSSVSTTSYTSLTATSAATASASPTTKFSSVATPVSSGTTSSGGAFYAVSAASTGDGYADPTYTDTSDSTSTSPSPTSLTDPTTTTAALDSVLALLTSTVPTALMSSAAPTVTASYADGTKTFSTAGMSVADLFTVLKEISAALRKALGGQSALVGGHFKVPTFRRGRSHARDLASKALGMKAE